ncbi:hypothetical protein [Niabella ginsengisoli]|uniref:Uncharacterized protein n=1 Tax=Niabella ginsengisoli TaxID=522298 RepID=A0ABS9SG46_9BACT|nr:hypothetical protein [Niabella ginsengisoli]MCH5597339.1 hypothetical protein [Niabella ginsengisoli]
MAKPNIDNYEDLMDEKDRLKSRLTESKANIKQAFEGIKDELNPFAAVKEMTHGALQTSTTNPLVKFGIKRATEFLIGKVLLKRAGWLPRLIVPFVVREIATRTIGVKADEKIASTLRNTADKLREVDIPQLSKGKKAQ